MRHAMIVLGLLLISNIAKAGLIIEFEPNDLTLISSGSDQTVDVNLTIRYDGIGEGALAGFTIDLANPGAGLSIAEGALASPFTWDFVGPLLEYQQPPDDVYRIGASSLFQNAIPTARTTLVTLEFTIDGSVTDQVFSLDMAIREATRGNFPNQSDIRSDVIVNNGQLSVSQVPEPSKWVLAIIAIAGGGLVHFVRRRWS